MKPKLSRLGLFLAGAYLALVLFSTGILFYSMLATPGTSELSGVPLIVLTQPWSSLLFRLLDAVHFNDKLWPVSAAMLLACSALNAFILYHIGGLVSRNVLHPRDKGVSKGGLLLAAVYLAVMVWAGFDMVRAAQAKTAPGVSVWVLTIASQPWQIPISMLLKMAYNLTNWTWLAFIPIPAALLLNGFVFYAAGASLFRRKVNPPNPTSA